MAFFPDLLDLGDVGIKKIRALSLPGAFFDNYQFFQATPTTSGMTDNEKKTLAPARGERGVEDQMGG